MPRICGICSVAQSAAAARALAQAIGLTPPENGRLAANLTLAAENLADHLSHFYLFFMPDFARADYAGHDWHALIVDRFKAMSGTGARQFLAARTTFLRLLGILAGKWPHTLALQPGGSSRPIRMAEKLQLSMLLTEMRAFLESTVYGDRLESVAALDSMSALMAWSEAAGPVASDFGRFLKLAGELELWQLGRAGDRYLSYGAYDLDEGRKLFTAGTWDGGLTGLDAEYIREDASRAWLFAENGPRHPRQGETRPRPEKDGAYTWCKAPRYDGSVVEVGALARQLIAGHSLALDLVARGGGNVFSRVVMRLLEVARLLPEMEVWVRALVPGAPFCVHADMPEEADGVGLVEAARGSLGHWLSVRRGRIENYQIIAPTTWNFSPRDASGTPGALEQALVGLPVDGPLPPPVFHVVRSFDPCMVCTVH